MNTRCALAVRLPVVPVVMATTWAVSVVPRFCPITSAIDVGKSIHPWLAISRMTAVMADEVCRMMQSTAPTTMNSSTDQ